MVARAIFLLVCLLSTVPALAHKLAPSLLQLQETANGEFEVAWKTPRFASTPVPLVPRLPSVCADTSERSAAYEGTGVRVSWRVRCTQPLGGQTLRINGLDANQSAALVRIGWLEGGVAQGLLSGASPEFHIPEQAGRLRISGDYSVLGIGHILGGIDHLLFVLGLMLLVDGTRRLVWTITAFTVGHSATLGLATLGFLRYPVDLVEFTIALSIFLVAVELGRERDPRHWLRHRPWLAAGLFGLLHGMGFAGALREVGLPAHEIPLALFAFNIGIELGQLAFVAVALLAGYAWMRWSPGRRLELGWVPVYLIGVLSAYWCIERGLATLQVG